MRRIAAIFMVSLSILAVGVPRAAAASPPNILFIMADDYPWPLYGFMDDITSAHPMQHEDLELPDNPNRVDGSYTPGIDRLANQGVVFPLGQSGASVCHPSFQATLTGLYEKDFKKGRFERPTGVNPYYMVEYLNTALGAGVHYRSLGFGKIWTRGGFTKAGFEFGWTSKGGARTSITPIAQFIGGQYDDFCGDTQAECPSPRPSASLPWFVWYAPNLPHYPADAKKLTKRTLDGSCTPTVNCLELPPTSTALADLQTAYDAMLAAEAVDPANPDAATHAKYIQNIILLDYWVDQLLKVLEANGAANSNTLIVYQGDNGYILPKSKRANGENAFRTPIIVRWPARFGGSQVRDQMVSALDFLPTLVDYAADKTFVTCPLGKSPSNTNFPPAANCASGDPVTCGCFEGASMRPYIENAALPGRNHIRGMQKDGAVYLRTAAGLRVTRTASCNYRLFDLNHDADEKTNCLKDPCSGLAAGFEDKDPAAGQCTPAELQTAGSPCQRMKAWQDDLAVWRPCN